MESFNFDSPTRFELNNNDIPVMPCTYRSPSTFREGISDGIDGSLSFFIAFVQLDGEVFFHCFGGNMAD